jgi:amidase
LSEADLVVCGPLARSAEDLSFALDLLAGPDEARAKAYKLALPAARGASLAEYRIGVWLDDAAFPVDAEVLAVLERALQALAQAGARLHHDARPELTLAEVYDNYRSLLTPIMVSDMPQAVHEFLAQAAGTPRADGAEDPLLRFARDATQRHVDWLRANERRERYKARWADFFRRYDLLLCPVSPVAAIAHDTEGTQLSRRIPVNGAERPYMDLLSWISLATAAHLPATVAPAGRTAAGLPVGLQIIGPYLEDRSTLDFAQRIAAVIGGFVAPAGY